MEENGEKTRSALGQHHTGSHMGEPSIPDLNATYAYNTFYTFSLNSPQIQNSAKRSTFVFKTISSLRKHLQCP